MDRNEQIVEAYAELFSDIETKERAIAYKAFCVGSKWADGNPNWKDATEEVPDSSRDILIYVDDNYLEVGFFED